VVSHNMTTISELCDRAVWLASGRVRDIGPASTIIQKYLSDGVESSVSWSPKRRVRNDFYYNKVEIVAGASEDASDAFPADSPIDIVFDFTVADELAPGRIIMRLSDDDGKIIMTSTSSDSLAYKTQQWPLGPQRLRCTIPGTLLVPGQYSVSFNEYPSTERKFHSDALTFTISEQNSLLARDRRPGLIAPLLQWAAEKG
jgi:lipopolysaccharide transport system ATP-binding protein